MLTYFFTILLGVIFGILQMNQTEIYWTEEYYKYALRVDKLAKEKEEKAREEEKALLEMEKAAQEKQSISELPAAEPAESDSPISVC
jgi:hypothetical protein